MSKRARNSVQIRPASMVLPDPTSSAIRMPFAGDSEGEEGLVLMGIEIGVRDPHAVHKIYADVQRVNVGQVSARSADLP